LDKVLLSKEVEQMGLLRKNGQSVGEFLLVVTVLESVRANNSSAAIVWLRAKPSRYCSPRAPVPCCAPPWLLCPPPRCAA